MEIIYIQSRVKKFNFYICRRSYIEWRPYVVSALKYRPQTFDEVVGQKGVTQTLENAIDKNQLAQALLFCGPRGVGKTSCARILAKKSTVKDKKI